MSFKRDGDNPELLGNLRKRRVKELLAEDIPEDEAFLMSNGRFACTVCHHHPVFDTISMLAIHRKGKKHLNSVQYHEQKKQELKDLIRRRKHEQFLKDGTTDINMPARKESSLLGACLYDPRTKRQKGKPYDRKLRLNLSEKSEAEPEPSGTNLSSLPGFTKVLHESSQPFIHSSKLKDVFRDRRKEQDPLHVQPYVKKFGSCSNIASSHVPPVGYHSAHSHDVHSTHDSLVHNPNDFILAAPQVSMITVAPPPPPPEPTPQRKLKKKPSGGKSSVRVENSSKTDKQLKAEQYLKLTESGWKRDRGGNWVKDEEAEFDSDEETPTLQL